MTDFSHWPEDYGEVPMVSVYTYHLHYGMSERFNEVIGKIHEAILESDWPVHYAWVVRIIVIQVVLILGLTRNRAGWTRAI